MKEHDHNKDCHHNHSHSMNSHNEKVVLFSLLLTFSFMLVEFVGGIVSGSLALIADAGHMFIDTSALALSWAGFYFGRKKASSSKTFGYYRFEVIAALVNAVTLILLILWIAYEAYERYHNPVEIMALPMFIVALVGLFVNILVFYILTKGDKEHLNIKGAILHVLGDMLGSIGAIASAVVIYLTGWVPIDSILSIGVCFIILRSTWRLLNDSLHILMEGVPNDIDINAIKEHILLSVPEVIDVYHIHVWAISSGKVMITLNISIRDESGHIEVVKKVKEELEHKFNIDHSTVEIGESDCPLA